MPCSKLTNILQGQENVSDLSYSTGERGGGGGGGDCCWEPTEAQDNMWPFA